MKEEWEGIGWEERRVKKPETMEDERDLLRMWAERRNQALAEGSGEFGAATLIGRRQCEATLEAGGAPAEYARSILGHLDFVERMLAAGNADMAARYAFQAGKEYSFAVTKFRWEAASIRGDKVAGGARNSALQVNQKYVPDRERRMARMAELVPALGVEKAARECSSEGLGSAGAIKKQWNRWRNRDS